MKFGEKLKELRGGKALTQPEMADAIGIEQSYLSKLENDRSLPSNEIFVRILEIFGLSIADVVDDLDQRSQIQLRQLPDVANYYHQQRQLIIGNRQRWLMGSAILAALGAALIYAGSVHLFFTDVVYEYRSEGVVLAGESKEIFYDPAKAVPRVADHDEVVRITDSIKARVDEQYILVNDYRGDIYNIEVEGGSRTYYLTNSRSTHPWQSKLVVFVGVLMTMFGVIGFLLERKLSHYH